MAVIPAEAKNSSSKIVVVCANVTHAKPLIIIQKCWCYLVTYILSVFELGSAVFIEK